MVGIMIAHLVGLCIGHFHLLMTSPNVDFRVQTNSLYKDLTKILPLQEYEGGIGRDGFVLGSKAVRKETIREGTGSDMEYEDDEFRHDIKLLKSQDGLSSDVSLEDLNKDAPSSSIEINSTVLIMIGVGLVLLAGLMSGLTLGLMSLDLVDLEVLRRSGTDKQKKYAERIMPVIESPHRLLVTLLLMNAAAAEALPLVLDRLTDPITAVILSMFVILIVGEIFPQAACSRYGLEIGAISAPLVELLMIMAYPVAAPIAWILDLILGHQENALFRRTELRALVELYGQQSFGGELSVDEINVIRGALDLTSKSAETAMTPIEVVTMLSEDDELNSATMNRILASGHSRIPVHRAGNSQEIVGIILVKELILIDPNSGVKVYEVKMRPIIKINIRTKLYDMLKLFRLGRSHMVALTDLTPAAQTALQLAKREEEEGIDCYSISEGGEFSDSEMDVEYQNGQTQAELERGRKILEQMKTGRGFDADDIVPVGIVTIEDVIEELLGTEILDETDAFVDNLHLHRVNEQDVQREESTLPLDMRLAVWNTYVPYYRSKKQVLGNVYKGKYSHRHSFGSQPIRETGSFSPRRLMNQRGSRSFHLPRRRSEIDNRSPDGIGPSNAMTSDGITKNGIDGDENVTGVGMHQISWSIMGSEKRVMDSRDSVNPQEKEREALLLMKKSRKNSNHKIDLESGVCNLEDELNCSDLDVPLLGSVQTDSHPSSLRRNESI